MSVQTEYNDYMDAGRAGQLANTEPKTMVSRNIETVAGVGFGKPVSQGTADDGCKLAATGDTAILGVTVREYSTDARSPDVFPQYSSARIITKGVIWVEAAGAVAAGDPVFVTLADATFNKTGDVQIDGARWDTSTSGAALAVIRLA